MPTSLVKPASDNNSAETTQSREGRCSWLIRQTTQRKASRALKVNRCDPKNESADGIRDGKYGSQH